MSFYLIVKVIHVVSATILFGTGLGTAFHMWMAHLSRDAKAITVVAGNVVRADLYFTTPAVIVQPLSGFALIWLTGISPIESWLIAAYALYLLTGACWLPVVWMQIRARDLAVNAVANNVPLPAAYDRLMRCWFWLGWPAFAAVLLIFWLMVEKPALW